MPQPLIKPYPEFPLTPHKRGYWVKVVNGVQHRFGARWCEPDEALEEWMSQRKDLIEGRKIEVDPDGVTLREGLAGFLASRKKRVASGEIKQRTYDEYNNDCKLIRDILGANALLESIGAGHFKRLRDAMTGTPQVIGNKISRYRVIFKYMHDAGFVDKEFRYGPDFKRPSAKSVRLARAEKPPKLFSPEQIKNLLAKAKPQMKAMIWLGLYAGFGNTDCATVRVEHFHGEWVEYHRPKTGVERMAWLPGVARSDIESASRENGICFRTKYGNTWEGVGSSNPISAEFRKLARVCGVELGFYALRHTCETIGGRCKDQVAVNYVMGHVDRTMAATYREGIDNERIKAVGIEIEKWLA